MPRKTSINGKGWVIDYKGKRALLQVAITKKMFKKAVMRNLIKRRIINAFLAIRTESMAFTRCMIKDKVNIIKINPSKEIADISFRDLTEIITQVPIELLL